MPEPQPRPRGRSRPDPGADGHARVRGRTHDLQPHGKVRTQIRDFYSQIRYICTLCRFLCLYGKRGISCLELPRRSGRNGRFSRGDKKVSVRSFGVADRFLVNTAFRALYFPLSEGRKTLFSSDTQKTIQTATVTKLNMKLKYLLHCS